MHVRQILQQKASDEVVCIAPKELVSQAANVLSNRKIGSLIVTSDGKTADGILSERDIVREIGKRGAGCLSDQVGAMMTPKPKTCQSEDSAESVMERMTEGRFRHMPVVDNNVLVGMITLGDVVKARLSELAMEKDALEGMIMGH